MCLNTIFDKAKLKLELRTDKAKLKLELRTSFRQQELIVIISEKSSLPYVVPDVSMFVRTDNYAEKG